MRIWKTLFAIVVVSLTLVACGGGSDDEPEAVPVSLCSSYDKIKARMTYDQVRDIVGRDYDSVKVYGTTPTYTWKHSDSNGTLNVGIGDKGVGSKSLVNLCGGGSIKYIL